MTVARDIERVERALEPLLGQADTDAWIDEPREDWDGQCAYDLIEAGRTDEVMAAATERANARWDGLVETAYPRESRT